MYDVFADYYESAEGALITPGRCLTLLREHYVPDDEETLFFEEFGFAPQYDAQAVLAWLGY